MEQFREIIITLIALAVLVIYPILEKKFEKNKNKKGVKNEKEREMEKPE